MWYWNIKTIPASANRNKVICQLRGLNLYKTCLSSLYLNLAYIPVPTILILCNNVVRISTLDRNELILLYPIDLNNWIVLRLFKLNRTKSVAYLSKVGMSLCSDVFQRSAHTHAGTVAASARRRRRPGNMYRYWDTGGSQLLWVRGGAQLSLRLSLSAAIIACRGNQADHTAHHAPFNPGLLILYASSPNANACQFIYHWTSDMICYFNTINLDTRITYKILDWFILGRRRYILVVNCL